ncbi:MAG: hypothetical protein HC881_10275 [Leptolyngbyaceae cyanobacterium SL_7_1]|nr:hypothetical protein [Leptolyngbyaceae cyanobacterium SL_7_1]
MQQPYSPCQRLRSSLNETRHGNHPWRSQPCNNAPNANRLTIFDRNSRLSRLLYTLELYLAA